MKGYRFQKGVSGNPSGCPKGAHHKGRPADWLAETCRKYIRDRKLIEVLADIAAGKDFPQRINENGEIIEIPACVKDRERAIEMLKDWGYGKAIGTLEMPDGARLAGGATILILPPQDSGEAGRVL